MSEKYEGSIHSRELKELICEIGRRVYNKGFAAANDGNISIRVGENEVLCSPTMICKGFMKPEDLCAVDLDGNQIAGKRKRTSEILLHLTIMKERPDVRAVVHCHPPHATAFAIAHEAIPQCVLPEVEVFMGEIPMAPYETPGSQKFADTVSPFLQSTNTIILKNHGTVSFGTHLMEAYWKTEILDAYCKMLLLAKQLGQIKYFNQQETTELLDLKQRLGFDDPRFHVENCDLCGNSAFRDGYKEELPQQRAFEPAPEYPGYLQSKSNNGQTNNTNMDDLVKTITEQVIARMGSTN